MRAAAPVPPRTHLPPEHTSRRFGTLNVEFRTMYSQDRARKKGAKALNRKAHSPEVHRACANLPYREWTKKAQKNTRYQSLD